MLPALLERADHAELLCRLALFLLRVHRAPLVASRGLLKHLIQIQAKATMRLTEQRDMVGYNLHALQWMRRDIEAADNEQLFHDATVARRTRDKRARTRQAVKRPIVTVT
ncbi:WD repeat-containing protein 3-like [Bicyclus anynana]|uniref:WD repeat-containing protein 3-like n=1 Tax=Bicyclus anynana TaxID=110368 RepID=A0ABM3LMG0_BICAN|nr:WD repeat-containing protein 3-like [Bicyclus anynana]